MSNVLELRHVSKAFAQAGEDLVILEDANLILPQGVTASLIGPSGAGKSTFLHIAGLLERPDSGEIYICNQSAHHANDATRTAFRRQHIGFIYQQHHLLPDFSALENVAMPCRIAGKSKKWAHQRAKELLERLQLSDRLTHRPAALSGGEQQRVAIARALANQPQLILADEPTGNLDPETASHVFGLLKESVSDTQTSLLLVTHDHRLAAQASLQFALEQHHIIRR